MEIRVSMFSAPRIDRENWEKQRHNPSKVAMKTQSSLCVSGFEWMQSAVVRCSTLWYHSFKPMRFLKVEA